MSDRAWEQLLESVEQAPIPLGSGLAYWCLCAMDQMQSITSMIPCLGLVSLLALAFSVKLDATSKLCQTCPRLLTVRRPDVSFFMGTGGDHGAWPHPSSLPPAVSIGAGIPYCPEPLCSITWCYESFCRFPLWKEPRTAYLGFLQCYLPDPINF